MANGSASASNTVTAMSTGAAGAAIIYAVKCWQTHQIIVPDETQASVLAGFIVPFGYAVRALFSALFQKIFGKSIEQLEHEGRM